jgi:uncharacterized repeat protein (TIGR03803 family)
MRCDRSLGKLGAALLVGIVVILGLAAEVSAQGNYKSLHRFNGRAGIFPEGVIFDSAGRLYGTTFQGGNLRDCGGLGCGVVFKLTPNQDGSWTESVLHRFTGKDGAGPIAGLIFDTAGNLYGTTALGGRDNVGTVFKLMPNTDGSWTETVLHSFTGGLDGRNPSAGLIFDTAGNLYGTTQGEFGHTSGNVFKLMPNSDRSWTETVLYSFTGGADGGFPFAGLIFDTARNLYGTTHMGGRDNLGTVFKLMPNSDGSWTETVLHSFTLGPDGQGPDDGLIFDTAGNLYGTTQYGGPDDAGTVFKLMPNSDGSWTETVLYSFTGGADGFEPQAGLIFDTAGNLYGTTPGGGAAGLGVVFKLVPNSNGKWKETVLHSFFDHPGADPFPGVIFDAKGNLYGTTAGDTTKTFGSVFEITP